MFQIEWTGQVDIALR